MPNFTYSFSNLERDLTVVMERLQEMNPTALSLFTLNVGSKGQRAKHTHEWYDYPQAAESSQINNGAGAASGQKDIIVDDGTVFAAGDVITFKDASYEICTIDSIATNTLTVLVNLTASHVDNVVVLKVSHPRQQGSSASGETISQATLLENFTEIFRYDVPVPRTMLSKTLEDSRYFR